MKKILQEDKEYVYLQPNAKKILANTRTYIKEYHLLDNNIIPCDDHSFYICPWVGTKQMDTLVKLLSCGLKETLEIISVSSSSYYIKVTTELSIKDFIQRLKKCKLNLDDPSLVLLEGQVPKVDKYDAMVPDTLLRKAFVYNQMDILSVIKLFQ